MNDFSVGGMFGLFWHFNIIYTLFYNAWVSTS